MKTFILTRIKIFFANDSQDFSQYTSEKSSQEKIFGL